MFEYLISRYGYVALVIGTFLEGEGILIAAGFAVHLGYLELPRVILAAFGGSLASDQLYFFLGRMKGDLFLRKHPRWEAKVKKVWKLFDRYRTLLTLGFRFVYGFRTVTPFAIGLSNIRASHFLVLNVTSLGRSAGQSWWLFSATFSGPRQRRSPGIYGNTGAGSLRAYSRPLPRFG